MDLQGASAIRFRPTLLQLQGTALWKKRPSGSHESGQEQGVAEPPDQVSHQPTRRTAARRRPPPRHLREEAPKLTGDLALVTCAGHLLAIGFVYSRAAGHTGLKQSFVKKQRSANADLAAQPSHEAAA
jgi:hypothetical protein